jgi:hypothetical protein
MLKKVLPPLLHAQSQRQRFIIFRSLDLILLLLTHRIVLMSNQHYLRKARRSQWQLQHPLLHLQAKREMFVTESQFNPSTDKIANLVGKK